MAAKNFTVLLFLIVVAAAGLWPRLEATNYTVGGSVGWKVPPSATTFSDWASQYTFEVGDILMFNFPTGKHDVAVVTKEDLDACNTSSPINLLNTGPVSYTLDSEGAYYFICTFPNHCSKGQKLAISVGNSSNGPAPSSSTSVLPSPGSSDGSALLAVYKLVVVSIVTGLMC